MEVQAAALKSPAVCIQLAVSDLGATEAFYAGILELPIRRALTAPGAPEHLILEQEGWNLLFVEEVGVASEHPVLERNLSQFPKGVGISLHIRVTGIEGIFDALMEESLEFLYPLRRHPYGLKDIWCYDPDGYLVVLEEVAKR